MYVYYTCHYTRTSLALILIDVNLYNDFLYIVKSKKYNIYNLYLYICTV